MKRILSSLQKNDKNKSKCFAIRNEQDIEKIIIELSEDIDSFVSDDLSFFHYQIDFYFTKSNVSIEIICTTQQNVVFTDLRDVLKIVLFFDPIKEMRNHHFSSLKNNLSYYIDNKEEFEFVFNEIIICYKKNALIKDKKELLAMIDSAIMLDMRH